jgi:hypothetical protein
VSLAEKQAKIKELAVAVASRIYHYKWIAASVGISEKTIIEWRKADPNFESQLDQARAEFIDKNMKKARPEFLLESADRDIFGQKAKIEVEQRDPITLMIKKFGLDNIEKSEGGKDDGQNDGDVPVSSPENA